MVVEEFNIGRTQIGYITMSGKVPTKYFNERFYS